jgi:hypothetical protein
MYTNGKLQGGRKLKPKPKLKAREKDKNKIRGKGHYSPSKKLAWYMLGNASDNMPYHEAKARFHSQNIECHAE